VAAGGRGEETIMIDEKFSLREFESRGRNSEAASELASALQAVVAEVALPEVRKLAERVAERLRSLGHSLTETSYELDPGGMASVTFVDLSDGNNKEAHRLRFNLDLVVSAGFPGYEEGQEEEEVSGLTRFDPSLLHPPGSR
jgi:hypothetical protein